MHSHFRGPITLERIAEFMTKTAAKAKEWGFNKYFVDFREADEKEISITDDYYLAYEKAKEFGFKSGSRHALLIRHDDEIDQWEFVEIVFKNAGYDLRIFKEEVETYNWIRK